MTCKIARSGKRPIKSLPDTPHVAIGSRSMLLAVRPTLWGSHASIFSLPSSHALLLLHLSVSFSPVTRVILIQICRCRPLLRASLPSSPRRRKRRPHHQRRFGGRRPRLNLHRRDVRRCCVVCHDPVVFFAFHPHAPHASMHNMSTQPSNLCTLAVHDSPAICLLCNRHLQRVLRDCGSMLQLHTSTWCEIRTSLFSIVQSDTGRTVASRTR